MSPTNEQKLKQIFDVLFENPADVTVLEREYHPLWDSAAHTILVAAIESEFDLTLEIEDMERMASYGATRLLLEGRGL